MMGAPPEFEAQDRQGWTALHHAVYYKKTDWVEFLLKNIPGPV